MKNNFTLGVDIGGTHTDAVMIDHQQNIIKAKKVATTSPLEKGFRNVLLQVLDGFEFPLRTIQSICVGTTHATNALLENKELYKVGIIRLAGQKETSLPPCYGWSEELLTSVVAGSVIVQGGFECDGRVMGALNREDIRKAADFLIASGAESLAITGVFSPLNSGQEKSVGELIREHFNGTIPFSLSHEIGGIGIIERENATVLNAALKKVMAHGLKELDKIKGELGLSCPLYVSQNNGSLIELQQAIDYPILTLFAGQTNSFVGGARLAGLSNALLIDIGGTSTDVGVIKNGIPKQSLNNCTIGGIPLNFANPDVLSIALGGGSYVTENGVGPQSCAKNLFSRSQAFGGPNLTLTDAALKLGLLKIPEANRALVKLTAAEARKVMKLVGIRLKSLIDKTLLNGSEFPVVIVGGGAHLLSRDFLDLDYIIPELGNVANAYGAALGEMSAKVDRIVSLSDREQTLKKLQEQAIQAAIDKGACPQRVSIKDVQIIPYHYMQGHQARVIMIAGGTRSLNST